MTLGLLYKAMNGYLDDAELKESLEWFRETSDRLFLLGNEFKHAHRAVQAEVFRLQGYLDARTSK